MLFIWKTWAIRLFEIPLFPFLCSPLHSPSLREVAVREGDRVCLLFLSLTFLMSCKPKQEKRRFLRTGSPTWYTAHYNFSLGSRQTCSRWKLIESWPSPVLDDFLHQRATWFMRDLGETLWSSIFPFQNENDDQIDPIDCLQGLKEELSVMRSRCERFNKGEV